MRLLEKFSIVVWARVLHQVGLPVFTHTWKQLSIVSYKTISPQNNYPLWAKIKSGASKNGVTLFAE